MRRAPARARGGSRAALDLAWRGTVGTAAAVALLAVGVSAGGAAPWLLVLLGILLTISFVFAVDRTPFVEEQLDDAAPPDGPLAVRARAPTAWRAAAATLVPAAVAVAVVLATGDRRLAGVLGASMLGPGVAALVRARLVRRWERRTGTSVVRAGGRYVRAPSG